MQVDKARLDDEAVEIIVSSPWAATQDAIALLATEVLELRSLRSTEGKEGEIEQLKRERDEAWDARNENAKLKGQRDAALARIKEMQDSNSRMAEAFGKLTDRAEAAEAHVAKLTEALAPFALKMDWPLAEIDAGQQVSCELTWQRGGVSFGLAVDDFRRARAALTRSPE